MTDEELRDRALSITLKHADVVQAEEVVALAKRYAEAAKPREQEARDLFAAAALTGLLARALTDSDGWGVAKESEAARIAFDYADAMLKARAALSTAGEPGKGAGK